MKTTTLLYMETQTQYVHIVLKKLNHVSLIPFGITHSKTGRRRLSPENELSNSLDPKPKRKDFQQENFWQQSMIWLWRNSIVCVWWIIPNNQLFHFQSLFLPCGGKNVFLPKVGKDFLLRHRKWRQKEISYLREGKNFPFLGKNTTEVFPQNHSRVTYENSSFLPI